VEDRASSFPAPQYQFASYLNSGNFATIDAASGDTSLQSIAVRSTADLIASLTSELPAEIFANGSKRKGSIPDNILDPGGDGRGREDWLYRVIMAEFENSWDSLGRAKTVDLLNPDDVSLVPNGNSCDWYVRGMKVEGDFLRQFKHWRANPIAGRELGLSVVQAHAVSIGTTLSAARYGKQWFEDGAHPSGMLVNAADINEAQATAAKTKFNTAMQGSREPLVIGKGWDYKPIQVTAEESQFLATQRFSEAQCARMFGPGFAEIMGYETGGSMTYANVVDRRQDLLVLSMNKWVRRAERILTELLPPSTQVVKLNREALLEATTLQRYQAHVLSLAWKTPNEIRAIEDEPPVEGGDTLAKAPAPNTNPQGASNGS
jgi:HK97 family phage portal protein